MEQAQKDMFRFCLMVEQISLKARLEKASNYILNIELQLECKLLEAQLGAINGALKALDQGIV